MNNDRRKRIRAVAETLVRLRGEIGDCVSDLNDILGEEQEALKNLPDSLKEGERGQQMQSAVDDLESALSDLDGWDIDAVESLLDAATQ